MTYNNIPNADLQAGAPIKQETMEALDGNLDAAFAGDAGAPKLEARVYAPLASGGDTGNRRYYDNNEETKEDTGYTTAFEISFVQEGSIRVQCEQYRSGSSGTASMQFRLDGVTTNTFTTTSASWTERAATIALTGNNRISVHIQGSGPGVIGQARRFSLRTDGQTIHFVPIQARYGTTPSS